MKTQARRNVLITGASGNVGQAAVAEFKKSNYHVIALVTPGKKVPSGLSDCELVEADLRDSRDTNRAIEKILNNNRQIHAALLTAGGYRGGGLEVAEMEDVEKMMSLNFATAFNVAKPIFERMMVHQFGRIVLFGARPALDPRAALHSVAYALSKSLIFRLAEMLNETGAPSVVTSVIVPSIIDTPQNREAMPDASFGNWVSPEAIAEMMRFLCSSEADAVREPVVKMYAKS